MVPNGWTLNNFNSVAELIHGFQFREHHFSESGVPIVKIASISHLRGVSLEKCSYISEELASEFFKYQIEAGDVLMALTGGTLGKTCKVQEDIELCLQNYRVGNFKPKASFLDKDFLYYFLISFTIQKRIENIVNEAAQPNVGKADFDKIKVLTPPLPEQRKIAKILSTWDKAISTTERLIDNSKQQKKALMQQLLTGKKRLLDDSGEPFEGEWEEVKLCKVAEVVMGSSPKSASYNENNEGLPLIQGNADIKNRRSVPRIYTSEVTKRCSVGDILLSVRAPVGTVAKSVHEACIGRGISAISAKKHHVQEYLYQWLLWFEPRWEKYSQGSTFEAVNSNDIKSLHLSIPEHSEQARIAAVLSNADKEIELLEQQLADLKLEKKALMQQLLTGKRRVKVDEEAVA